MIQLFRIKNVSFIIIELFNQTASQQTQKNLLYLLTSYIYIYLFYFLLVQIYFV